MRAWTKRSLKRTIPVESTAEAYLELLHDWGIEYFFGTQRQEARSRVSD
jgi:hypothetical protein